VTGDIGNVLAVIAADGNRLGDSVDVGLTVFGSVLGDPTIYRRRNGRRLAYLYRRGAEHAT